MCGICLANIKNIHNNYQISAIQPNKEIIWCVSNKNILEYNKVTEEFIVHNYSNSNLPDSKIYCVAKEDSFLWFGINNGVVKYDNSTWTIYSISNDEYIVNNIQSISIDKNKLLWAGSEKGLYKFDYSKWILYDNYKQMSNMPQAEIRKVAIDSNNTVWFSFGYSHGGMFHGGLGKFDGSNWQLFFEPTLPSEIVTEIIIDSDNKKYFSCAFDCDTPEFCPGGGIAIYNDSTWIYYNKSNSTLPTNSISCLNIDSNNHIWAGTYSNGIAYYNSIEWKLFNTDNSELLSNRINCISVDSKNIIWLSTVYGGLTKIENGIVQTNVISNSGNKIFLKDFQLYQNHPNPFNPITTIQYSLQKSSHVILKIYNLTGQEIETLVDEYETTGEHVINWLPRGLPNGIYLYRLQAGEFSETKKLVYQK